MIARLFEHPLSLLVLILIIVVVLGWKRLPDMARSLGRSSRILKSEIDEMKAESQSKASNETVEGETTTRSATTTDGTDGATRADKRRDV